MEGIFVVFGVAFLVSAIVFQTVCEEVKIVQSPRRALGDLVKRPSLWIIGILFTFASGANLGIYSIVPLFLTKELSLSIGYANTILGISRLGGIAVAVLAGFLVDRINLRNMLFVLMGISGLLTVLLGISPVRHVGIFLFMQAVLVTGFFSCGLLSRLPGCSTEK